MHYETRAVLAAAYRRQDQSRFTYRTHTIAIEQGGEERALCGRVKVEHLADPGADDTAAAPTCATCQRRDPRFRTR